MTNQLADLLAKASVVAHSSSVICDLGGQHRFSASWLELVRIPVLVADSCPSLLLCCHGFFLPEASQPAASQQPACRQQPAGQLAAFATDKHMHLNVCSWDPGVPRMNFATNFKIYKTELHTFL